MFWCGIMLRCCVMLWCGIVLCFCSKFPSSLLKRANYMLLCVYYDDNDCDITMTIFN